MDGPLPKFSNALTLSQLGGTDSEIMPTHLALPHPKEFCDYAPGKNSPLLKTFKKNIQLNRCI